LAQLLLVGHELATGSLVRPIDVPLHRSNYTYHLVSTLAVRSDPQSPYCNVR
jgi:hypothetical protein